MLFAGVQPPVKTLGFFEFIMTWEKAPGGYLPGFHNWLVVSNMFYVPFHIWDVILPIDFHIFEDCQNHQPDNVAPPSYDSIYICNCRIL